VDKRKLLARIINNPRSVRFFHGQAKPYQVRQFLKIVERHNLRPGGE
jgi:hypothetical protein